MEGKAGVDGRGGEGQALFVPQLLEAGTGDRAVKAV